jgi:hypothetical protein
MTSLRFRKKLFTEKDTAIYYWFTEIGAIVFGDGYFESTFKRKEEEIRD